MRFIISVVFFLSLSAFALGQRISKADTIERVNKMGAVNKGWMINTNTKWYSETISDGIIIENSFPKGGPYPGATQRNFNYSYLVFFTRVMNVTATPIELTIHFSADSIAIPDSPDTFVKLFLPPDTMTLTKQVSYSYGITGLESFDRPSRFQRTINPNEESLFYVVAIFYQTSAAARDQQRGGNRAELVLKGQDLFYSMSPQIQSLPCGHIISKK